MGFHVYAKGIQHCEEGKINIELQFEETEKKRCMHSHRVLFTIEPHYGEHVYRIMQTDYNHMPVKMNTNITVRESLNASVVPLLQWGSTDVTFCIIEDTKEYKIWFKDYILLNINKPKGFTCVIGRAVADAEGEEEEED